MRKQYKDIETCPLAGVQKVVHGKWTMVIIYYLSETTLRFSELKRKIPQVTEANLTKELRMLEEYDCDNAQKPLVERLWQSDVKVSRKFI